MQRSWSINFIKKICLYSTWCLALCRWCRPHTRCTHLYSFVLRTVAFGTIYAYCSIMIARLCFFSGLWLNLPAQSYGRRSAWMSHDLFMLTIMEVWWSLKTCLIQGAGNCLPLYITLKKFGSCTWWTWWFNLWYQYTHIICRNQDVYSFAHVQETMWSGWKWGGSQNLQECKHHSSLEK